MACLVCVHRCCCSVAQSCVTLCDLMGHSTPGFPVHHQLPQLAQTHVYQVSDAIQPSSVVPFSSCLQPFPASGSLPMKRCAQGSPLFSPVLAAGIAHPLWLRSLAGSLSYCVGSCFWSARPSELAGGANPLCRFQSSRKRYRIPEV